MKKQNTEAPAMRGKVQMALNSFWGVLARACRGIEHPVFYDLPQYQCKDKGCKGFRGGDGTPQCTCKCPCGKVVFACKEEACVKKARSTRKIVEVTQQRFEEFGQSLGQGEDRKPERGGAKFQKIIEELENISDERVLIVSSFSRPLD